MKAIFLPVLGDFSIKIKLTLTSLLVSLAVLVAAVGAFIIYERTAFKNSMVTDIQVLTRAAGRWIAPDLEFGGIQLPGPGQGAAGEAINSPTLKNIEDFSEDLGKVSKIQFTFQVFNRYGTNISPHPVITNPPELGKKDFRFLGNKLHMVHRIYSDAETGPEENERRKSEIETGPPGEFLGVVFVVADLSERNALFWKNIFRAGLVLCIAMILCLPLVNRLMNLIVRPILNLSQVAREVSEREDYSVRAIKQSNDEVGMLTDSFNQMLERIQRASEELRASHAQLGRYSQDLEKRVEQRTRQLAAATEEAEAARQTAEKANKAKSMFLANMSHEIRTPMNAILGYAQIMRRDPELLPKQRQAVETIEKSGDHLLGMINDILDLSKIEAGRMELHPTDFDLCTFVQGLSAMFQIRCEQKGLTWKVETVGTPAGHSRCMVRGDESKLRQVLINLLGNAVKFTDQGSVTLRIEADSRMPHTTAGAVGPGVGPPLRFHFAVIDTGPGIASDFEAGLFQPFQQGEHAQDKGGAGLGLALSRKHLELMGARLEFQSQPGQGTRFYFDLEFEPATADYEVVRRDSEGKEYSRLASGSEVRALVVDDIKDNRDVLVQMLSGIGCEAEAAESGPRALECLASLRPRIIFMDIRMPGMDGMEAAQKIRSSYSEPVKIVALTASAMAHEEDAFRRSCFDDYIAKPFRFEKVCEILKDHLKVEFAGRDKSSQNGEMDTAIDWASFRVPKELLNRLDTAARETSITRLKKCVAEIRDLAPEYAPVADNLRQLVRDYDMDGIKEVIRMLTGNETKP